MHRLPIAIISLLIPVSLSIRCYSGQQTGVEGGALYQEVNCPTSDFCFNNYVKRHHNGDKTFTITKSCGESICFEARCDGPRDERRCCCVGDLCNSSNGLSLGIAGVLIILYRML